MDRVRRALVAACLGAAILGSSACRQLPDDHYLQTWSRRTLTRWRQLDPAELGLSLGGAVRGLRRTFANLAPLGLPSPRGLPRAADRVTQHAGRDLRSLPGRLGGRLRGLAHDELHAFAAGLRRERTPLGGAYRLAPPLHRFVRGLREAPTTLGLERRILPGPTDPERRTSIHERPREETMGERLLQRVLR